MISASNLSLYFLAFFTALIIAWLATWLVRRWAIKFQVFDEPGPRKIHRRAIPLLGGVGVYVSLVLSILILWPHLLDGIIVSKYLLGIIVAGGLLVIGGVLDDKFNLPPRRQIIFPILASLVIVISGIGIKYITNPWGGYLHFDEWKLLLFWHAGVPYYFTVAADVFTFVWLMGMMYVTKLLDGLDGLASGIGVIGSFIIFGVSLFWDVNNSATSLLALILAGALTGFLLWNWHPAKIFLGEGGSVLIGFVLGVLAIISGGKIATALLIMGIPILDVVWVIVRRLFFDRQSITQADRQHLHHRLLDVGFSHRGAVIFLYVVTAIFGLSSIWQVTGGKIKTLVALVVFMAILAYYLLFKHKRAVKS